MNNFFLYCNFEKNIVEIDIQKNVKNTLKTVDLKSYLVMYLAVNKNFKFMHYFF